MSNCLLISLPDVGSLSAGAELLAKYLGVSAPEQRQSSHYPDETYYVLRALGLAVNVALNDDLAESDYPLRVWVEADRIWLPELVVLDAVADIVARFIATKGVRVARPIESVSGATVLLVYSYVDNLDLPPSKWIKVLETSV